MSKQPIIKDIPMLKVPSIVRNNFSSFCSSRGIKLRKLTNVKLNYTNYRYKVIDITLEELEELRQYQVTTNIVDVVIGYLTGNKIYRKDIGDREDINSAKRAGKSNRYYYMGLKSTNYKKYRYFRFVGRGKFDVGERLFKEKFEDMKQYIVNYLYDNYENDNQMSEALYKELGYSNRSAFTQKLILLQEYATNYLWNSFKSTRKIYRHLKRLENV